MSTTIPRASKSLTKSTKPHFFSPEAKAQRSEARLNMIRDHIVALKDNNSVLLTNGHTKESLTYINDKKLTGIETMFKRLSLKELTLVLDLLVQCEEVGQILGRNNSVSIAV